MSKANEIILLHGALGSGHDLAPLAKELTAKGFACHAFTFSGHGDRPFASQFGIAQFAAELNALVTEKSLQQAPIFGYSMGGYVALYNAYLNKNHFGRIVTLGTKMDWNAAGVEKEKMFLNPETILQKSPPFAKALQQAHGERWKELLAKTALLMDEIVDKQFLSETAFKQIQNKTLLGRADNDKMVSLTETLGAMQALPHAQLYSLQGAHPLGSVNAGELAGLIAGFVSGN